MSVVSHDGRLAHTVGIPVGKERYIKGAALGEGTFGL